MGLRRAQKYARLVAWAIGLENTGDLDNRAQGVDISSRLAIAMPIRPWCEGTPVLR